MDKSYKNLKKESMIFWENINNWRIMCDKTKLKKIFIKNSGVDKKNII